MVTTTKKIKFNVRENTHKEEIILELTQVSNEDIDTAVILLIILVFWYRQKINKLVKKEICLKKL